MRKFFFLIGRDDQFSSGLDLVKSFLIEFDGGENFEGSKYVVELPEGLELQGYNGLHEIAHRILLGEAMLDSWCLDGVYTVLLESTAPGLRSWEGDDDWVHIPSDPSKLYALI